MADIDPSDDLASMVIDHVVCILNNHFVVVAKIPLLAVTKQRNIMAAIRGCRAMLCVTGKFEV